MWFHGPGPAAWSAYGMRQNMIIKPVFDVKYGGTEQETAAQARSLHAINDGAEARRRSTFTITRIRKLIVFECQFSAARCAFAADEGVLPSTPILPRSRAQRSGACGCAAARVRTPAG